uniref:Uncharacterized protein n=1 Tax=Physcomitrium patens TaxID=3218 RepID=A0A2K1JWB1_PHYPA|nr:hypothetical protein PHYPA_015593 [Physcomitrium patens]
MKDGEAFASAGAAVGSWSNDGPGRGGAGGDSTRDTAGGRRSPDCPSLPPASRGTGYRS